MQSCAAVHINVICYRTKVYPEAEKPRRHADQNILRAQNVFCMLLQNLDLTNKPRSSRIGKSHVGREGQ